MSLLSDNKRISQIIKILRKAVRNLPTPSVTLVGKKWKSPFLVLISCILSLRTKDQTTLKASERLFALADNPSTMMKLEVEEISSAIYPVGFYHTKARSIKMICRDLVEKFHGQVPDEIDILLTLHGVGRKTANLVLTEGFGKLAICVDTHVHRISNRLGYVRTKTPEETEMSLRKKLPKEFWIEYNALLVVWGQNVCRPISPLCSQCPVAALCPKKGVGAKR
jgi:endonuclease-3